MSKLYDDLLGEFTEKTIQDYCERSGVIFNMENPSLVQIKNSITTDFDRKVIENGEDEIINFLSYMILNFHEFKSNVDDIEDDSEFFFNEIDPTVLIVDGVKVGDKLRLEKRDSVMIVEIIGFTDINIPIVEYLEVDYINDINSQVDNGRGVDFLTLREDFGSVTEINDDVDKQVEGRKYHLEGLMTDEQREELIDVFREFNERKDKECPDMHVDFGYAMVALGDGVLGKPLARVSGEQMRKSGYPQMSVAIDSSGDLFLYREAGFLDRPGNQKFTAGRIGDKSIEGTLQDFVNDRVEVDRKESDCRFMDSYDHLMTLLVNQTESDMEMGIQSPVRIEKEEQEGQISNNWYKDESN